MSIQTLGIDPGMTADNPTGFCIIEEAGSNLSIVRWGVIEPEMKLSWIDRCEAITEQLVSVVPMLAQVVAYEEPFIGVNRQTGLQLARLCGMFHGAIKTTRPDVRVCPVPIATAKVALSSNAHATKAEMVGMIYRLFGAKVKAHVADACGVALAAKASMAYLAN